MDLGCGGRYKKGGSGHQARWAIGLGPIGLVPIGLGQIAQRLGDLVLNVATPFLAFWADLGHTQFAITIHI